MSPTSQEDSRSMITSLKTSILSEGEKSSNLIVDLMDYVEHPEAHQWTLVQHAITSLLQALEYLVSKRIDSTSAKLARSKYNSWLDTMLVDFSDALIALLPNGSELSSISVEALFNLLPLMTTSKQSKEEDEEDKQWSPTQVQVLHKFIDSFLKLPTGKVKKLLSETSGLSSLLKSYTDLKHQALAAIARLIKSEITPSSETESDSKKLSPEMTATIKSLLELIDLSHESKSLNINDPSNDLQVLICSYEGLEYSRNDSGLRFSFSSAWDAFLRHGRLAGNVELYKQVVLLVSTRVMPHHRRPLLLTDFLLESYDVGGAVSILALEGVFQLVQKHNLEYPDFYKKLYSLMTIENMLAKYRPRLLYLSNIFMGSSHLPEYLVASFVKRLARISLQLSAEALMSVMPFIGNLIMRHKGLIRMIQGSNNRNENEMENDPFIADEEYPSKTRATESFLWEVQTLQSHALPQVSKMAKELSMVSKRNIEYNLADYLDLTHSDLFETEVKKHVFVNVALTFKRPVGVKSPENELLAKYFKMN